MADSKTIMDPETLIAAVANWAQLDTRVVAATLCGSHARNEARPDSDIDLILVTSKPTSLIDDRAWLNNFGDPLLVADEDWGLVQSIRVYYGELEVEFGITGLGWVEPPIDSGTAAVMREPMRILYDPESLITKAIAEVRPYAE